MEMWIEMQNWRQEIGMEMERNDRDLKVKNAIFAISGALNL